MVPRRRFGRHADEVSILGLGGYHLGQVSTIAEAVRIVHAAIDAGVHLPRQRLGVPRRRERRAHGPRHPRPPGDVFLMTKVCTHGRDAKVAMRQLEESLRRLRTDYLDLWQVHECVYYNDPERHFAAGGVIEALDRAKPQGKVRFVGFTGHKDPAIHLRDAVVRLSVRRLPAAAQRLRRQLPQLRARRCCRSWQRQGIAAIGMKSLGGSGKAVKKRVVRVEDALRYAMSLPVCTTVSGIDSMSGAAPAT